MRLRRLHIHRRHLPHLAIGIGTLVLFFGTLGPLLWTNSVNASQLDLRSVQLSDGTNGMTGVQYQMGFTTKTSASIGSITFQICSNYLFTAADVCAKPLGFDASAAQLSDQTGVTDFSLSPASTDHELLITRTPSVVTPQPLTYTFSEITNPSNQGSYYVHIETFSSTDGTGTPVDYGDAVFATNPTIDISTEVPPYLQFCVGITIDGYNCGTATGGEVDFGELSTTSTRTGTSQMLASTNAPYGYSITLSGSTMTAGNNVIPAMTGAASQIGTSEFGLNARANTSPLSGLDPDGPGFTVPSAGYDTPNQFKFVSGDIIASSNTTDDFRKLTVTYIVNRNVGQPPGKYVATVSYICLANF